MILVDTSVWIDDLRRPSRKLRDRVDAGDVFSHEMVIGELACGNLPDRNGFLHRLGALPAIRVPPLPVLSLKSVVSPFGELS